MNNNFLKTVTISTILTTILVGCEDSPKQRDIYASMDDCMKEWEFNDLCEKTSVTDASNKTNNYVLSPYYEPGNRGVEQLEYDDDDNPHYTYFYPVNTGSAIYSPMVGSSSPAYLRPSGTYRSWSSGSARPTSTPKSSVAVSNIVRGGFGSSGAKAMSFGG